MITMLCTHTGCRNTQPCDVHKRTSKLYSLQRWRGKRGLRIMFLKENPLCVRCEGMGITTPAEEVDHVMPHHDNEARFFDWNNLQGLCKPHHSAKTREDQRG